MMSKNDLYVHESFQQEALWTKAVPVQKVILMELLLQANDEEKVVIWEGQMRTLHPWQLTISLQQLAKAVDSKFSITKVKNILKKFADLKFLTYETSGEYVWITIVQRDKFAFEPPTIHTAL